MELTQERATEILMENTFAVGKEVGTEDTMVVFDSWSAIGQAILEANNLDEQTDEELIEEFKEKGIEDPENYLKELKGGHVKVGSNDFAAFPNGEPPFRDIYYSIDDIMEISDGNRDNVYLGFTDEYTLCDKCCGIIRTSPDSYHWVPNYVDTGWEYICEECVKSDPEILFDSVMNKLKSLPDVGIDIEEHGWVKVNDDSLQNGMHEGMADDPEEVLDAMQENGINIIFDVHPSQFYVEFDVYVKEENLDKAKEIFYNTAYELPYEESPAYLMQKGLKEATIKMGELSDSKIKYASVNADGTADVKSVSAEDFINGNM